MDTKAAFEKWWKDEYSNLESSKYTDLVPHIKYGFFQAWQQSRAAIEIPSSSDSEYWFEGTFQRMRYERDVEKAIGSGIRIKGKTS